MEKELNGSWGGKRKANQLACFWFQGETKKKGKGEVDTVILQVTLSTSRYSVHYVLPVTH